MKTVNSYIHSNHASLYSDKYFIYYGHVTKKCDVALGFERFQQKYTIMPPMSVLFECRST